MVTYTYIYMYIHIIVYDPYEDRGIDIDIQAKSRSTSGFQNLHRGRIRVLLVGSSQGPGFQQQPAHARDSQPGSGWDK